MTRQEIENRFYLELKEYQKIYDETCRIQVQEVKLGDVNYYARCKLSMLEDLLKSAEQGQIKYKEQGNDTLVEWYQGQIEAYKLSVDIVKDLVSTYNRL